MDPSATIVAFATAVAAAERIVLRTSGPEALTIAAGLCDGVPASAGPVTLAFADLACPAWLYVFRGPRSYTGEDTVEYHVPGSPVLARLLYDELLARGCRPAEPGEFTARAYFHGRLDLTAAEGVAATIAAGNAAELAAARQFMAGALADRLRPITDDLADTVALVEVGIDFTDEDVTVLPADELRRRIAAADGALAAVVADADRFEPLSHEPRVVLCGRPNAGKSSLLNALAGRGRAAVSAVAGTTRDVISVAVDLPRGRVQLVDAAGVEDGCQIMPAGRSPPDPGLRRTPDAGSGGVMRLPAVDVPASTRGGDEGEATPRSRADDAEVSAADGGMGAAVGDDGGDTVRSHVDANTSAAGGDLGEATRSGVADAVASAPGENMGDAVRSRVVGVMASAAGSGVGEAMRSRAADAIASADVLVLVRAATDGRPDVVLPRRPDVRVVNKADLTGEAGVSAVTGVGLAELRSAIDAAAFGSPGGGRVALNRRHVAAITDARSALADAMDHADVAELAAADLRAALDAVGSVVGAVTPDDVLGRVFAGFCIGK